MSGLCVPCVVALVLPQVTERYGAMLEQYLRNVGDYKTDLGHQLFVMSRLEQTALKVHPCPALCPRPVGLSVSWVVSVSYVADLLVGASRGSITVVGVLGVPPPCEVVVGVKPSLPWPGPGMSSSDQGVQLEGGARSRPCERPQLHRIPREVPAAVVAGLPGVGPEPGPHEVPCHELQEAAAVAELQVVPGPDKEHCGNANNRCGPSYCHGGTCVCSRCGTSRSVWVAWLARVTIVVSRCCSSQATTFGRTSSRCRSS